MTKKQLKARVAELEANVDVGLPYTGGNMVTKEAERMARDIDLKGATGINYTNPYKGNNNNYFYLQNWARYFGAMVTLHSVSQPFLTKRFIQLFQLAFIYGGLFFEIKENNKKVNELVNIYVVSSVELTNEYGEPIKVKGSKLQGYIAAQTEIDPNKLVTLDVNVGIIFMWDAFNRSAFVDFMPLVNVTNQVLDKLNTVIKLNSKRVVVTIPSGVDLEYIKILRDNLESDKSYYFNIKGDIDENATITPIERFDTKVDNIKEMTDYIEWFKSYWFEQYGIKTNISFKKERNVTAEVDNDQQFTDIRQSWHFHNIRALASKLIEKGILPKDTEIML